MGFLSMIGLVTAEEHAKLDTLFATVAKERNEALIAVSNAELKLKAGKAEMERLARGWDKCGDDLKIMKADRDKAVRDYSEMSGIVSQRDAEIVGLRAQADAATEVIAELKPDAEAMRAKRQRDREQKAAQAEAKGLKTGKATGKPRTAIPAKVGKTATAKITGDRPAKKAKR